MHFALPALPPGRRRPARSATLIRRRAVGRKRSSRSALALFMFALAAAATSIVLAAAVGTLYPVPLLGRFLPVPNSAIAESGSVDDGPAPLSVRTLPAGARVVLDGRARGRAPLELHTSPGQHRVLLEADDSISARETVEVVETGTVLDVVLWTRQPMVIRLRPPYPGAQFADAAFLSDGRVKVAVALPDRQVGQPARSLRESWLIEPAAGAERGATAAPAGPRAPVVAVSPDGRRIATLQDTSRLRSAGASAVVQTGRLDSVWVGDVGTHGDPGTAILRLDPPAQTMVGLAAREEMADVAWLPDNRHLLIASRFGDPAVGGPVRTRLLIVDAGAPGEERIDVQPAELIVVPAEVLLDSAVWSSDARHVAVLLRAATALGAKRLVGLGVIDVSPAAGEAFQYVADLGPEDGAAGRLPVAPVAWEPCPPNDVCGAEQHLTYTAPVPNAGAASAGPLGLLGLARQSSASPRGLFVSTLSAPALATGDAPRLGTATGIVGLAWRSVASGIEGAPLLGVVQTANGALALRAIDPASGRVQDLGVQLATDVGAGAGLVVVRWDVPHARALVLAWSSGRSAGADGIVAWLVDFSTASRGAK